MKLINWECLEETDKLIEKLYTIDKETLRWIARILKTNHHTVKRVLLRNWIEINNKNRKKRVLTEEHKEKIRRVWQNNKWTICTEEINRKNMVWHMRRNITIQDLEQYTDIIKLKFLNKVISRHWKYFKERDKYLQYLAKFYSNYTFNIIYNEWIKSWMCQWRMPSLEHILPTSRWGTFDLDNLTFITRFENRAKANMTLEEWNSFKKETWTKSNLFYL